MLAPAGAYADTFDNTDFYAGGSGGGTGVEPCTDVGDSSGTPIRPLVENGPTLTGTSATTGDLTRNSNSSDVIHYATTVTGTARFTSGGGEPAVLSLQGKGSVAVTTELPESACTLAAEAFMETDFELTVTEPRLLVASVRSSSAQGAGTFIIRGVNSVGAYTDLDLSLSGTSVNSTASGRALLPAGQYEGYLDVLATYRGSTAFTGSSTSEVRAVLYALGSRIGKVRGGGKKYVTLPASRTCPAGSAKSTITGNGTRAGDIRKVEFFVGDKRVKRVANPKKGASVKLRAPSAQDVTVRAVVTLDNGQSKAVRASYIACTV